MSERSPYKRNTFDSKKIFFISLSGVLAIIALSVFYYYVISKPRLDEQKINLERLKQENKLLVLKNLERELELNKRNDKVESMSLDSQEITNTVHANDVEKNIYNEPPITKEPDSTTVPPPQKKVDEIKIANIQKESPESDRISIYEERRLQGLEQFEKEVVQLAKKADQMDVEYRRYKDSCMNQSTQIYSYGRSWFSVWDGYTYVNNESLPECKKIWSDFVRLTEEIKAGMIYSMERARKAGVYPGQVRKVREKYYLDWEGWEKE